MTHWGPPIPWVPPLVTPSPTCICHSHLSILGSCLPWCINPQRQLPTSQKSMRTRVLPGCHDWLVLVIGSFERAGRVDHLPRVPDGRAGLEHCWAGLGALINKCQQRGKCCNHCSRDARSLFRTFACVGGRFWAGKKYIWVQGNLLHILGPCPRPRVGAAGWIAVDGFG